MKKLRQGNLRHLQKVLWLASQEKQGFKPSPGPSQQETLVEQSCFPICKMGIITCIWKSGHEMVFEKCLAQERPNTQQMFSTQILSSSPEDKI